jgi:general secretion pathway protein I
LCRSERHSRKGSPGFTVVEALAALVVLMVCLAAIGSLASTSLRSTLEAEQHLAQVSAAQKIMAGLPGRNALPLGRLTGVLDKHPWRVDSTPIATTDLGRSAEWTPQGIALMVRSPSGSTMEVDTIRLRAATK